MTIDVKKIKKDYKAFEEQLRKPTGDQGRTVAKFISKHNKPPMMWAISNLNIKPNDTVLEIGYGTGHAIKEISKLLSNGKIIGIDFSDIMKDDATELNKDEIQNGKVILQLSDINDLDKINFFNKILGINVLYFWEEPIEILKKLHSSLKPKGRIVLFLYHKDYRSDDSSFLNYSSEEGVTLLKDAGFRNCFYKEKKFNNTGKLGICLIAEK